MKVPRSAEYRALENLGLIRNSNYIDLSGLVHTEKRGKNMKVSKEQGEQLLLVIKQRFPEEGYYIKPSTWGNDNYILYDKEGCQLTGAKNGDLIYMTNDLVFKYLEEIGLCSIKDERIYFNNLSILTRGRTSCRL